MKKISVFLLALLLVPSVAFGTPSSADQLMQICSMPGPCAKTLVSIVNNLASPFPNNTYVTFRNAANLANIDVLKVDATDDTVLNADTGDIIKLSVAGTSEVQVDNDSLTFTGASSSLAFGATSGLFKVNGNTELTLADDKLTFSGAAATIVPGATSIAFRNNADSQNNLLISNAGAVTTAAGITATTGNITATAGGFVASASGQTLELQEATAGAKCMGSLTATGATPVVTATTCAKTASRIFLTRTSAETGTTDAWISAISNGVSFSVTSEAADTGTYNFLIINEAA